MKDPFIQNIFYLFGVCSAYKGYKQQNRKSSKAFIHFHIQAFLLIFFKQERNSIVSSIPQFDLTSQYFELPDVCWLTASVRLSNREVLLISIEHWHSYPGVMSLLRLDNRNIYVFVTYQEYRSSIFIKLHQEYYVCVWCLTLKAPNIDMNK